MRREEVGIGIIGYGTMGRAHAYGYTLAPRVRALRHRPRLRVISGRNAAAAAAVAQRWGIERSVADWREVIADPAVEIVDVCTPPGTHSEIVRAAAQAGKAVLCEKPLAAELAGAQRAAEAVRAAGVLGAIGFNYRRLPALALMKRLIEEGRVGTPRLWRGAWLSDEFLDPELPFDWRFRRSLGASTLADLGAHLIDLALWMVGRVRSVSAQAETFVSARPGPAGEEGLAVDVEDATAALLRFDGGALGVMETAKVCPGRPCDFTLEVNGTTGTLRFDYARLNELWYADAGDPPEVGGMRRIRAEAPAHPQTEGWWPVGQGIGYGASFVNQAADLLAAWPDGPWAPDLDWGLAVQSVCESVERAASENRWVEVEEAQSRALA